LVKDFNDNGTIGWSMFAAVGGNLIFDASEGSTQDLWISDGTIAGTQPIGAQVDPQTSPVVLNGILYFAGYSDAELDTYDGSTNCPFGGPYFLWRSDGTAPGTYNVDPTQDYCLTELAVVGPAIYFDGDVGSQGRELWRYVP
jgi:hypothetical protein